LTRHDHSTWFSQHMLLEQPAYYRLFKHLCFSL